MNPTPKWNNFERPSSTIIMLLYFLYIYISVSTTKFTLSSFSHTLSLSLHTPHDDTHAACLFCWTELKKPIA